MDTRVFAAPKRLRPHRRVKPAYDEVCWMRPRISHRSFLGPSVIAARKSLRVNGGFGEPPSRRNEGDGTPKGAPCNSRGLFPGSPGNRGTRQRLSTFRHGVLKPWSALPGTWLLAGSRRLPVPVQPT